MSDTGSRWSRRARLAALVVAGANVVAITVSAGPETALIHVLLAATSVFLAVRPPVGIDPRDGLGFSAGLTVLTVVNELLEGIEPVNDIYEAWLVFVLVLVLAWVAIRRGQIAGELKRSLDERERLLRRQERLMHDLSHELRTPATIARGHLETLARLDDDSRAAAAIALDELARVDRIVERLVLLARAERGRLVELGEIDTEQFLEDVLIRWSGTAERTWRLGAVPSGLLEADPDALRIALDALLENAVKYTEPGDRIELKAAADRGRISIVVTDSGPGVPLDAAESIFGRSSRAREGARPGLGLGLAIVDAIAQAHGGTCVLEPSRAGTMFALTLPRFRENGAVAVAEPADDAPAPTTT